MIETMAVSSAHSKLAFSIHPLAHRAYDWVLSYPRLIQWTDLPTGFISQLLRQPLQGVMQYQQQGKTSSKMRPTEFQLYAPLWPALYWDTHHPPEGTLLIHNTSSHFPKNEDIEQQAWANAMSLLALSVNSGELAILREHFQALLPPHIAQHFFGRRTVSDRDLCKWMNRSRGTLVQQRKRTAAKVTPVKPICDPIALLNTDWKPVHGK